MRGLKNQKSERSLVLLAGPIKTLSLWLPAHSSILIHHRATHSLLSSPLLSSASLDSLAADGGKVRLLASKRAVEAASRSAAVGGYIKVTCPGGDYCREMVKKSMAGTAAVRW
ncbi:unnamed protein product [Urochloa humidicola]